MRKRRAFWGNNNILGVSARGASEIQREREKRISINTILNLLLDPWLDFCPSFRASWFNSCETRDRLYSWDWFWSCNWFCDWNWFWFCNWFCDWNSFVYCLVCLIPVSSRVSSFWLTLSCLLVTVCLCGPWEGFWDPWLLAAVYLDVKIINVLW